MSKLDAFDITDATYKTVGEAGIQVSIITPKDLKPGVYPVIIRFHGGFLITGHRLFEDWLHDW